MRRGYLGGRDTLPPPILSLALVTAARKKAVSSMVSSPVRHQGVIRSTPSAAEMLVPPSPPSSFATTTA